jgi:hypothetical protein
MTDQTENLPPAVSAPHPTPLNPADERTWAMLAHLSVLLNLVTAYVGVLVPLGIYLVFKDRSRYVAFQALQSFFMQLILWVGGSALVAAAWVAIGISSAFLIGLICIPIGLILTALPLVAIVYGVWAAIEASSGRDFRYWWLGNQLATRA